MAYVFVQVPAHLGTTDPNYLQEAQQEADANRDAIVEASEEETEAYNLAQQQAYRELFDSLPTKPAPQIKSAWPWIAAAGVVVLIALTSD